ncbi:MAG: hypothetical protein ABH858_05030 [Candidatus Omnitrophota bacterium]
MYKNKNYFHPCAVRLRTCPWMNGSFCHRNSPRKYPEEAFLRVDPGRNPVKMAGSICMQAGFNLLILLTFLIGFPAFGEEVYYRDPLIPLLPEEKVVEEVKPSNPVFEPKEEVPVNPPEITIEGIIWGGKDVYVIIDGNIYKEGDSLYGTESRIIKIIHGKVSIFHKGQVYEKTIN